MRRLVLGFTLSLLATCAQAGALSGLWVGYYAYDADDGGQKVETALVMETVGQDVGGTIIERQTFGDEVFPGYPSDLRGTVTAHGLRFEKRYVANGEASEPVVYELSLSPDGSLLTGFWTVGKMQGTAYFRRVTAASAERLPKP